jgi:nicotinic acid mononucleotide adenylyltransferase
MEHAIYDLPRLFAFRDALDTLGAAAPPTARVLWPESVEARSQRRIGLLCGSFNPLTLAHTELAERAHAVAGLDLVLFTLATVTVGKERVTGLSLEDRLLLLTLYTQSRPQLGVALVNRGLYFEQAQAFRVLCGPTVELSFVVGMDKLVQILDPQYYQDRDAALRQLFSLTSLIVANRGDMAQAEFEALLDQPQNRPYRSHITFCQLAGEMADVSATTVREHLAAGLRVEELAPAESAMFLAESRAFHPSPHHGATGRDAYGVRLHVFESLYANRAHARSAAEFRALVQAELARTSP